MQKQKEIKKYTQRDMRRQDNMLSYNIRLGCYGKGIKSKKAILENKEFTD